MGLIGVIGGILGCSSIQAPVQNLYVSETSHFSIHKNFRTQSSNTFPDSLAPFFPNPYNHNIGDSSVTLTFTTKDTGEVKIIIQNPLGDSVVIYQDSNLLPGFYTGFWNPVSKSGTRLRAGLYFITMRSAPNTYIYSRVLDIQSND